MIFIDLVLAGDNAVVVGLAAAGVPLAQRSRVILWGIIAAVILRIGFALVATHLITVIGLAVAGGILLLWVGWKLLRELKSAAHGNGDAESDQGENGRDGAKSARTAIIQIVLADVSMSLDNVLAVAGAAKDHPVALTLGLLCSVALMGAAAAIIAEHLRRRPWIGFVGVAVIVWVALVMIWEGSSQVLAAL